MALSSYGNHVIVVDDRDSGNLKNGELHCVRGFDGYGRLYLEGIDGPWNESRFKQAPPYKEVFEQRNELLKAVQAAMRIESLWGPTDCAVSLEHEEENHALKLMKDYFQKAIETCGESQQHSCGG